MEAKASPHAILDYSESRLNLLADNMKNGPNYQKAVDSSIDFLRTYSRTKVPTVHGFAGTPEPTYDKQQKVVEALAEAQFILNQTSTSALNRKEKYFSNIQQKQKVTNIIHFVTASGFVLMIGQIFTNLVPWVGAFFSLIAGVISITVPANLEALKKITFNDIQSLSALSGEITELQARLHVTDLSDDEKFAEKVFQAINACTTLSKKYELDQMAEFCAGNYPRESFDFDATVNQE